LAGAPGFEPGDGGIKIRVVRVIYQRAFRKSAEIPALSVQKASISEYQTNFRGSEAAVIGGSNRMSATVSIALRLPSCADHRSPAANNGRRHAIAQPVEHITFVMMGSWFESILRHHDLGLIIALNFFAVSVSMSVSHPQGFLAEVVVNRLPARVREQAVCRRSSNIQSVAAKSGSPRACRNAGKNPGRPADRRWRCHAR
jgi:hypothetical protein